MKEFAIPLRQIVRFPTTRNRSARPRFVALTIAFVSVIGCSKSTHVAHVQGKVTLNGREISKDTQAFITFKPEDKKIEEVTVQVINGRYDSPKNPTGALRAFFEINSMEGPAKKSQHSGQEYREVKSLVPSKYVTGVPLTIEGDEPNRDFQLTD
jgi:hypothetical protein